MSTLSLWTLASVLGCCVGYTIIQRSAEYYDYLKNPSEYQWQAFEYQIQPSEYQNPLYDYQSYDYQPYDYQPYEYQPYEYQPYDYRPYDYRPVYSTFYYYYYPLYAPPASHGNAPPEPKLPHAEAQHLLQVYRIIRVIVLFRDPIPKPLTAFDELIVELTQDTLQNKLVELLCDVEGYDEVAELTNDPAEKLHNTFVNDHEQLLSAIQRALNALDLTADLDEDLLEKLRSLRDLANSLTAEVVEAELQQPSHGHAKEALVADVLQNLLGNVESKDLKEFNDNFDVKVEDENMDKAEKYVVVIDDPATKVQQEQKTETQFDEVSLDEIAVALEMYLEEQKIAESNMAKEKSIVQEQIVESSPIPASTTTTQAPLKANVTEQSKSTWLGSLLGNGNLLSGHYESENEVPESQKLPLPIDVSQPAVLVESTKLDGQNLWTTEEDEDDDDLLDFDIDKRFQSPAPPNVVTQSVPLWLIESSKDQKVENKQLDLEDVLEDQTEDYDELQRQLLDEEGGLEVDNEPIELDDIIEARTDPEISQNEQTANGSNKVDEDENPISEIPVNEEKLQMIDEEGPARFDLPVDLNDNDPLGSDSKEPPSDEQQSHQQSNENNSVSTATDQITEPIPIESKEDPSSAAQTATLEPDARRFIREEVLKVLNLLEESNGFAELKQTISEQDINGLVDELNQVQVGLRWAEMIGTMQKMVMSKNLDNGPQIVDILEQWKLGEEGHLDDGYFDRTYGSNELAESRQIEEETEEADMEQLELAQLQAAVMESRDLEGGESTEEVTKPALFVDDEDNYFETNNKTTDQDEKVIAGEDDASNTLAGSRNARILTDDGHNDPEHFTPDTQNVDKTSVSSSIQAEEATDKLEVTTAYPFPADEA